MYLLHKIRYINLPKHFYILVTKFLQIVFKKKNAKPEIIFME